MPDANALFRLNNGQSRTASSRDIGDHVTPHNGQAPRDRLPVTPDAYAAPRFVGIDSLQQSGRLAGLSGGALLLLAALVAWLGTPATRLDAHWLGWAAVAAGLAAFGGPLLGSRPLGRESLTRRRLLLLAVMTLNTTAWAFASMVAVGSEPPSIVLLVVAGLALSFALLPSLSWLWGLAAQLAVQLLYSAAFAFVPYYGSEAFLLPLGLWASQAFLASMAAIYSRRVDLIKRDSHYLRVEAATLQRQMTDIELQLQQAQEQRKALEGELAEILDLAEDASRAKTEFLATMSHEIRTPLNGILPILEMLRDTRLDAEQLRLVNTAKSSSRHLLRIINDILDFAKVESGKLQLEAIEIDVRELVHSVAELMRGSARNRNLKLSGRVADDVPEMVRGDPIRLRQILINLVSNAVKFTEEGGIRIEVSRAQTSEKEVELLFAVADTGVGMAPETADRLFQSFTQADASTTRKHGGTGLGLVICKRLVELMGGRIGVRSTMGQGSTFWFLVPLRKSIMEVPSARRDLKGVRVLTLMSEPGTAARVSHDLRSWGVVEEACDDPEDALAKLRSTAMLGESWGYQLVLIDGAGIEPGLPVLLEEIRGDKTLQRLNVVVSIRSEMLAHKLRRDFGVMVLTDGVRTEPLRRMLHRLFDVESRHFGSIEMRAEEIYDDLNVSTADIGFDESPSEAPGNDFFGTVLLVEDNPVNMGVMRKALSRLGLGCETATDGQEALDMFERQRFDIVFMDCQMPVMDGYEATRRIRELEEGQGSVPTPVVAMTANAMSGDREKCLAAGMDDYLPKPVGLAQLRDCLEVWLGAAEEPVQKSPARVAETTVDQPQARPVLDAKVLRDLKEIMEDDYLSLLQTYLSSAPELIAQVQEAIVRSDVAAMVIPLHSLKSSSANVGAMHLSELAREAEKKARLGDFAAAEAAFRAVDLAFAGAETALREHVANPAPV
jgi:signal transduction histidine kinase/CheY-like chemotaxis protein/HPt (histidine-containing phosphotransfer) domain-containing protein